MIILHFEFPYHIPLQGGGPSAQSRRQRSEIY